MRTTLALDDDILAAARHLADRDRLSIGQVVSALARQGLARSARSARPLRNGVPLLPKRGGAKVTMQLVNQLRDEQP